MARHPPARELTARAQQIGEADGYREIIGLARGSNFFLLGEASHGTHEFYRTRAEITKRLITDAGFGAVAVEADWPDAYRVNRYARGESDDRDAVDALGGFERFPQWMWRNADVVEFVSWLREYNRSRPERERIGFYGMDLYSLHTSIRAVLDYLEEVDPVAAGRARYRYGCFEDFAEDPQAYGYAASFDLSRSCEDDAVAQLVDLRRRAAEYIRRDGHVAADELFFAEQNALLVTNAERYYRSMFQRRVSSWNLRDTHMVETLEALTAHQRSLGRSSCIAVWAHNSHLGDARATEMGDGGEVNVGQLLRQRHGGETVNVGFTTYTGTVTAASEWDGVAVLKQVRPALPDSYELLFHHVSEARAASGTENANNFMFLLKGYQPLTAALRGPLLERAIGVIYRPETERLSHYFRARLSEQFDAVLHYDETSGVAPLEKLAPVPADEPPETYPSGI